MGDPGPTGPQGFPGYGPPGDPGPTGEDYNGAARPISSQMIADQLYFMYVNDMFTDRQLYLLKETRKYMIEQGIIKRRR
jgi:hypothetical protein